MKYPKYMSIQGISWCYGQVMEETLQLEAVGGSKIATSMTEHFLRRHWHGGISQRNDSNNTRRIIALLELPLSFGQSARQMRVLLLVRKPKTWSWKCREFFKDEFFSNMQTKSVIMSSLERCWCRRLRFLQGLATKIARSASIRTGDPCDRVQVLFLSLSMWYCKIATGVVFANHSRQPLSATDFGGSPKWFSLCLWWSPGSETEEFNSAGVDVFVRALTGVRVTSLRPVEPVEYQNTEGNFYCKISIQ